jgi:hypothetical protein
MKRFDRRQAADDYQLKLIARADELKADLLVTATTTASATVVLDVDVVTDEETVLAPPRPSLDQMWGLE